MVNMRLIEADAVYKILESCEIRKATIGNQLTDWEHGYTCGIERAESEIECAQTIDAVPVRHGKWIDRNGRTVAPFWERYECSECGARSHNNKYCHNCGARMDAEKEEE